MKISDVAIDRNTTVILSLVLIAVMGMYAYFVLPLESEPDITVPYVIVTVTYQGVAPADMENLVTIPIERKITGISGVKEIRSVSQEGVSSIQIEFESDIIIDDALQKVRDKVDMAKADLPEEADEPMIQEINISELPIMFLSLIGDVGLATLTKIGEDLEDVVETVPGVLDAELVGDVEREIQIEVDPDRVAEYGVPLANLVTLMRVENVNTPSGSLELGEAKFMMRVPGEFKTPDEIRDLVVKADEKGIVYLRDIAEIRDGFKDIESLARLDGRPAVTLTISKRSGENVIYITDGVKRIVEEARKRLPAGVDITITMDESKDIRSMVSELENNIISGLILVLAVIFVFLGVLESIFVALAIPISMLITFIILHMCGTTLNMIVLFSLILALGMLVDNGIVVVENIHRHMQMGKDRIRASKDATAEVAWPITTSTLTTVAAFIPMLFWPGIWGDFMMFMPTTVSYALLGSLFVGLIVNPALAAKWMRIPKREMMDPEARKRAEADGVGVQKGPLRLYGALLRLALRWRAVTLTLAVTLLVLITAVFFLVDGRMEFVPETEPRRANIDIDCPEGTSLDTTDGFVRQIEKMVEPYRESVEFVIASSGSRGVSKFGESGGAGNSHIGRVSLDFLDLEKCKTLPSKIVEQFRKEFTGLTGAKVKVRESQMGPSEEYPVNIEISGEDFDELVKLAQLVQNTIEDVPGLVDMDDDCDQGKPEVRVTVDREQALLTGLNTEYVGLVVKAAISGRKAGEYREGDEEYDVMVRFPKSFREDLANVESMNLINLAGKPIPFASVAKLEYAGGPTKITRVDRKRTVTVFGEVEGRTANEVLADINLRLQKLEMPPGYRYEFTGEQEEQQESQSFLFKAFLVALLLIALILVAQFNSIAHPFIIMTSVILSLAGVFLGLIVFNMPFGVLMTGIGCISLAGVVVNNAIVLLDFINQLKARGLPVNEAIVEAGMARFRPVMLTAVTTVLGLVPMTIGISYDFKTLEWIFGGESAQWWGPMAVAVSFGLSFATLLTLIVVPVLYSVSVSIGNLVYRRKPAA